MKIRVVIKKPMADFDHTLHPRKKSNFPCSTRAVPLRHVNASDLSLYFPRVISCPIIRPKIWLANDGNYIELRCFSAWKQRDGLLEEFLLPPDVGDAISQTSLALDGVQVFLNASGSHHQVRKLKDRLDAIKGATRIRRDLYVYCIVVNGKVVAQGSQFYSFKQQASNWATKVPSITVPYRLYYHIPEEEIAFGPACWMWDYLRRSGASGFLLPFSGGEIANGDEQVKADAIRIGNYTDGQYPTHNKEFVKRIFYTVFMGTENGSDATRSRAKLLADEISSWHLDVSIDSVISSLISLFQTLTGKRPAYKVDGGSDAENLGLQNIQARIRMVLAYMLASLLPWAHSKPGFYLVLGSSDVDEALRGYFTKYDCSSADINPIGGISKQDLRTFLKWAAVNLGFSSLAEIEAAPPTAKLEPIRSTYSQKDEDDMGMQYEELSIYGRLRKISRFGPVSMFQDLCTKWGEKLSLLEIANKVKYFFKYYSINQHKMTVLTPSYHAESYSPEDNRFGHRPFLCNPNLPHQFRKIDELLNQFDGNNPIVGAWPDGSYHRSERW
ncbi:hypothetical protein MKX01_030412 [Papaver californicum]|nr:hypothetical protein MKX01_030412 [Papaver californicum]